MLAKMLRSWVCQVRTGLPNSDNVFLGRQRKMFDGRLLRRLKGVKRVLCHIFTTFSLAMPTLHMRKNETVHRGSSEAA